MRTIIAGSREGIALKDVQKAVADCGWKITGVVSGCARGVDSMGEVIAKQIGIPIYQYPADWRMHGKSAGPIRNALMAKNAEALVAVWDGKSRGTQDMIRQAKAQGLKVFVHRVREINLDYKEMEL